MLQNIKELLLQVEKKESKYCGCLFSIGFAKLAKEKTHLILKFIFNDIWSLNASNFVWNILLKPKNILAYNLKAYVYLLYSIFVYDKHRRGGQTSNFPFYRSVMMTVWTLRVVELTTHRLPVDWGGTTRTVTTSTPSVSPKKTVLTGNGILWRQSSTLAFNWTVLSLTRSWTTRPPTQPTSQSFPRDHKTERVA